MNVKKFKELKKGDKYKVDGIDKVFTIPWDIGDSESIPVCTSRQFEEFEISHAQFYFNDDVIKRYGKVIGTSKNIKLIGAKK